MVKNVRCQYVNHVCTYAVTIKIVIGKRACTSMHGENVEYLLP